MGVSVRRFLKFTALLVVFIALALYARSWTVAKVPIDEVLPTLQGQTNLPIHIPREIPGLSKVYADAPLSPLNSSEYEIFFDIEDICYSWRCRYASLFATKRKIEVDKTYTPVRLANGIKGMYNPSFFGGDVAVLVWQQDDIYYRIFIKNKNPQAAIQLANSTILGEFKRPPAIHPGTSH